MTDLSKLRHFSTTIFSETKSVTPIFFFIFGVSTLLPPQGFRPEAKSRGGTLVARAYIKDSTYSTNMQSVYRKKSRFARTGAARNR